MKFLWVKSLLAITLIFGVYGVWVIPKPADAGFGQQGIMMTSDEALVSYYQSGPKDGRVILLLASLGRSVSDFNLLVPSLNAAGFYTIAVDVRGVASSTLAPEQKAMTLFELANDLSMVLEQIGNGKDKPLIVIGHAFGNRLARAFAAKNTNTVKAIILLAAGGSQKLKPEQRPARALFNSFDWTLFPPKRIAEIKFAFFADGNEVPSSWKRGWYRAAAQLQIEAVRSTPLNEWRDGGGLAPILVVQAAQDAIAPAELTSARLLRDFPERVTVVTIERAGHALLPERPQMIENSIVDFLKRPQHNSNTIQNGQ